jgi:hypothetical protein
MSLGLVTCNKMVFLEDFHLSLSLSFYRLGQQLALNIENIEWFLFGHLRISDIIQIPTHLIVDTIEK